MTMITPSYLGETIEYSSLHACRSTLEDPTPFTRAQARRRRRDTLAVLGAVFVVTVLAGLVTGSNVAWALAGLDGVALAAYVGLLVHLRRMAAEREMKLHYLDVQSGQLARAGGLPTQMSGRYAHPSSQHAVAR